VYQLGDTICAIATPPHGARGVVRVSGPQALAAVATLFEPSEALAQLTTPTLLAGRISLAGSLALPCELYVWPTARSYTREPVVEVHTFGTQPLLSALVRELAAAGARPAEPGEFTLRAFLSGRIDLTQAEAVLGVIHSQGQRELDVALRQMAGGIARPMTATRDDLLDLLAELEAGLDFVEEDLQFIATDDVARRLRHALDVVEQLHRQMESRGRDEHHLRVVIAGSPNVGKSSLFNRLADDAQALVADLAGTTRDYVTGRMTLPGHGAASRIGRACELIDTAGIVDELLDDSPDRLAQHSARQQHASATLQLFCLDATRPANAWESAQLAIDRDDRIVVLTKTDQASGCPLPFSTAVRTSSHTGAGLAALRQAIANRLQALAPETQVVSATAHRCRESLRLATESLRRAIRLANAAGQEELIAAEIRVALAELGQVVGAVYTDDLLDRIFSRFCIGK
jgi:tRNA modification GTPase